MPATISLEQLCEAFWEAEDRLGLLDLEVDGVLVWQAARFLAFSDATIAVGVFERAQRPPVAGPRAVVGHALRLLGGALRQNPLIDTPKVDDVVLEAPRGQIVDGQNVDVHSQPIVEHLADEGRRVLLLDRDFDGEHHKAVDERRRYLDALELGRAVFRRLSRAKLPPAATATLREAERMIGEHAGAPVSLIGRTRDTLTAFRIDHAFYDALLRRAQPQRLYCVVAYAHLPPALAAARELGIESIEIQHGAISRFHMGYAYPTLPARGLAYLPDRLLLWDESWLRACPLPPTVEREVAGFAHLQASVERLRGEPKLENRLLVLSQGAIGRRLAALVAAHADALAGYDIVYKLHPGEYDRRHEYEGLRELERRPNVRVATELDLHLELARARWQLGVYSTALFEGLALGCQTVLAELPGIEFTRPLLEQRRAISFDAFVSGAAASP